MKQSLYLMKFGVTDLDEIRTLVKVWVDVVESISGQKPTKNAQECFQLSHNSVEVKVDKEQDLKQDVFLEYLAPLNIIDQFFKTLRQKGLNFTQEFDTEGPVIRCQLIPAAPQP
jgi:hypothetical protein